MFLSIGVNIFMKIELLNPFTNSTGVVDMFTLEDFQHIAFMIQNGSDESLSNFLESKISGDVDSVVKLLGLFQARMQFVGDNTTISNGESNVSIDLNYLYKNLESQITDIRCEISDGGVDILVGYPRKLYHKSGEYLFIDMIRDISYMGKSVGFGDMSPPEKYEIFEKLPGNLIKKIKEYVNDSMVRWILLKERVGLPEISISVLDNSAFDFLKILFGYYDYESVTETLFILCKRIPDIQYLNSRTPKDIELLVKLYSEELEKSDQGDKSLV